MKDNKIIIIGIIGLVIIVIYYLLTNKKKTADEVESGRAIQRISEDLTSGLGTITGASVVQKSDEDEDYQNLLAEYKRLNGGKLPSSATSLTASQLQLRIKELKELQDAINSYYAIEDDNLQLSSEDLKAQGYNTVEKINTLIKSVTARKTTESLVILCEQFISNCENADWTHTERIKYYPWDVNILNQMIALNKADKTQFQQIFKTKGGVNTPNDFGMADGKKKNFRNYLTISSALSTKAAGRRPNANKAKECVASFADIV